MSVKSGQSVTVLFTTANPSTGAATDATGTPTGTLYVNGTANAATVTVTNITTGIYKAALTLPTLAAGDVVSLRIAATVATIAGEGVVWQDVGDTYRESDTYGRIGAPTGASIAADLQTIDDYLDTEIGAIKLDTEAALTAIDVVDAKVEALDMSFNRMMSWEELRPAGDVDLWWIGCCASEDGQTIIVADSGNGIDFLEGGLYISRDGGDTWSLVPDFKAVSSCACSADGLTMLVGASGQGLYQSLDGGHVWTQKSALGSNWHSCDVSSDGSTLIATCGSAGAMWSTDGGTTWSSPAKPGSDPNTFHCCSTSEDGAYMAAGSTKRLWWSDDDGSSWTELRPAGDVDIAWGYVKVDMYAEFWASGVDDPGPPWTSVLYTSWDGIDWFISAPSGYLVTRGYGNSADVGMMMLPTSEGVLFSDDWGEAGSWTIINPYPNSLESLYYNDAFVNDAGTFMLLVAGCPPSNNVWHRACRVWRAAMPNLYQRRVQAEDGIAALLAGGSGSGSVEWTYTLTEADLTPIADAQVWVTTDSAGLNMVASGTTDQYGVVTFYLDPGTVYVWAQKSGWNFTNPDTEVVA